MNWELRFLPEAAEDMEKLNRSVLPQVLKGIKKVQQNPLPRIRGGYGEPLGNRSGNDLTGLYKIKFRSIGIRVINKICIRIYARTLFPRYSIPDLAQALGFPRKG